MSKTMFMKVPLLLLALCICSSIAFSQKDSIDLDGKTYTLHKVSKGETLYSVCNKYKVDMTEVVLINRIGGNGYSLDEGEVLVIPLYAKKPLIDAKDLKVSDDGYITHVVKQGETLYSICRSYNGVNVQMLKEKNNLKSDTVKINQKLMIPQEINVKSAYKETKKDEKKELTKADLQRADKRNNDPLEKQYTALEKSSESVDVSRGVATWLQNDQDENMQNFFALHKYAPIGTVIKVRNLMNNRTTFVKVIGKLPDNEENKNVIIKVSGATAHYLRVLDQKFLIELTILQATAPADESRVK